MPPHIIILQARDLASNKTKPEMVCLFLLILPLLGLSACLKADHVKVIPVIWNSIPNGEDILNCDFSEKQNITVSWKKDGQWISNGKQQKITVKRPSDAGNFTCWNNATHELLNYVTVYLWKTNNSSTTVQPNLEQDPDSGTYLKCRAKNYSGMFTCSLKLKRGLKHNEPLNFKITASQGNINCEEPISVKPREYSISCTKNNTCPVTEEYQPTELLLEVFYKKLYEKYQQSFFIKDILKPDTLECQFDSFGTLTWTPPKTWNTPHAYFELIYQIKIVHNEDEKVLCEIINSTELQHGGTFSCYNPQFHSGKLSIRSRDRYKKDSFWSEWSDPCRLTKISREKTNVELCHCKEELTLKN